MTRLLAAVCLARPAAGRADAVDDLVHGFLDRHRIPSAAIAVVREGRIAKAAGYGVANLELEVPASEKTVYEIGSITKQFTAEAVMMLVEEGKLRVDEPIGKYVAGVPDSWSAITIQHLLAHASGLLDWGSGTDFGASTPRPSSSG